MIYIGYWKESKLQSYWKERKKKIKDGATAKKFETYNKKITKEEENNVPLYQKLNQARAKKPPTDDPNG